MENFLYASLFSISISSRHGEALRLKREMWDLNKGEYNLMISAIGFRFDCATRGAVGVMQRLSSKTRIELSDLESRWCNDWNDHSLLAPQNRTKGNFLSSSNHPCDRRPSFSPETSPKTFNFLALCEFPIHPFANSRARYHIIPIVRERNSPLLSRISSCHLSSAHLEIQISKN